LSKIIRNHWPEVKLIRGDAARQERGSEDCGLHMVSHFFSEHTQTPIRNASTVASRLRRFLSAVVNDWWPKGDFLRRMSQILADKDVQLEGGSSSKKKQTIKSEVETPKKRGRPPKARRPETPPTPAPPTPVKQKKGRAPRSTISPASSTSKSTRNKQQSSKDNHHKELSPYDPFLTEPSEIDANVEKILATCRQVEEAVASRQQCYMLAATSLINAGEGKGLSLELDALANQVSRKHFKTKTHYDVGETLAAYGKRLDFLIPSGDSFELLQQVGGRNTSDALYVQGSPEMLGLPSLIDDYRFVLGVVFSGEMEGYRLGREGVNRGHYTVTIKPEDSTFAVYLKRDLTKYPKSAQRQSGPQIKIDNAPDEASQHKIKKRKMKEDTGEEIRVDNVTSVLNEPVPGNLNSVGLRMEGVAASPKDWYVYPSMPSSLQPIAWQARTEGTRRLHLKWINEIKCMPQDLLNRDLPQAILELVRRVGTARAWSWSTYAKALVSIQSALENLPLYTNQKKGIKLSDCPEWRASVAGAQLKEKESVPVTEDPLTIEEFEEAERMLHNDKPEAALFLTMMWMFAARPGDIARIRKRDVTFSPPDEQGNIPTSITIREGKAVKFRGPYPISTVLLQTDASKLLKLMEAATRSQRIFSDLNQLKLTARTALQRVRKDLSLPLVRKGAVCHLARVGVPEEQLMRLTGHTLVNTLRRYLGYGRQLTAEGAEAQASAGRLHQKQNSSE